MKSRQPSGTYKKLYNNIIADLIFQICNANHDLGARTIIRGDILPVALWKKIETYEAVALENMSGKRLDRHKLASCICGAIIEIKPIVNLKRNDIRKNVNEILALYTALNVIKAFMIYDLIGEKTDRGSDELRQHLRSSFDMKLPSMDENICDTQDYRKNIINALYWSHENCSITRRECFRYDIWAYSKIFYHLELYNKAFLEQSCKEYFEHRSVN